MIEMCGMLIEYRHKVQYSGDERCEGCRRNEQEMMEDLTRLVKDVSDEGIPLELKETILNDSAEEMNEVILDGRSIRDILKDITIVSSCSLEESSCGTDSCQTCATPNLDWIEEVIEDIPEHLLKMAISKMIMDHPAE